MHDKIVILLHANASDVVKDRRTGIRDEEDDDEEERSYNITPHRHVSTHERVYGG